MSDTKIHLFNEYEAHTPDGIRLGDRAQEALQPIIDSLISMGASVRDIETVIVERVATMCADRRIQRAHAAWKSRKR